MFKKIIPLLMLIILASLFAKRIDQNQAESVAKNWMNNLRNNVNVGEVSLVETSDIINQNSIYVFSFSKGGFVIVSGDDQLKPVLGYSKNAPAGKNIESPATKDMLRRFDKMATELIKSGYENRDNNLEFNLILNNKLDYLDEVNSKDVNPLIPCEWNQGSGWNAYCPLDASGPGGRVYAGCVTTAMAQVMRKWNSPSQGTGSHGYTHPTYGYLSANFGNTTYDWASMSNTTATNAAALLMYQCGVAVDMNYSPDGSGAYPSDAAYAMANYFGYSNADLKWKDSYTESTWNTMLRNELDSGSPLVYVGYDTNGAGGHAFNLDGYQNTDYFHINWGWSGSYNGYFYLSNMSAGSYNFSDNQGAIFGLTPSSTPDQDQYLKSISPAEISGILNDQFTVYVGVEDVTNLFGVSFNLEFDQNYINAVSVTNEPFFGNDVVFMPNTDNNNGLVSVGITRKAGQGNIAGTGNVVKVVFELINVPNQSYDLLFNVKDIVANDSNGNSVSLIPVGSSTTINITRGVWAGDTNNNGYVDQADVLPLGLYWNMTGPSRSNASTSWTEQLCLPWTTVYATYADCDGDGIINQADVLPIGLNWNKSHSKYMPIDTYIPTPDKNQMLKSVSPAVVDGILDNEFSLYVSAQDVTNLFGVSFNLEFDQNYINAVSVTNEPFFGNDVVFMPNIDNSNGLVSVGITRKVGQGNISGTGNIVSIRFKIVELPTESHDLLFNFTDIVANDENGTSIGLTSEGSTTTIVLAGIEDDRIPYSTKLHQNYPNPFNPETTINFELINSGIVNISVYNYNGELVNTLVDRKLDMGMHRVKWNGKNSMLKPVPSGVYFINMQTGNSREIIKSLLVR